MNFLKKLFLFLFLTLVTVGTVSASEYKDSFFNELERTPADGFQTVITDIRGNTHRYDGILQPETLEESDVVEAVASYEILQQGSRLIQATLHDILPKNAELFEDGTPLLNGYYSVTFQVSPEENTYAFVTGLTDTNLSLVQTAVVSAKLNGIQFSMESLDFIDAEKTQLPSDGDNELCWAAASSNVLHYTGWGKQAGFDTNDDLLDYFRNSFNDSSSNPLFAFEWFFNGTYLVQDYEGWAHVIEYGNSGGKLKQYSYIAVTEHMNTASNHHYMEKAAALLQEGYGTCVSLGWVNDEGVRNGGHSVTLWGYLYDEDIPISESEHFIAIIVSDSDSDMQADSDRRTAPNKLHLLEMSPYVSDEYDSWRLNSYGDGVLEEVIALMPFSETLDCETDPGASLDPFSHPDMYIEALAVINDPLDSSCERSLFSQNDSLYLSLEIANAAPAIDNGSLAYTITVKNDADDSIVLDKTVSSSMSLDSYASCLFSGIALGRFDNAGCYTVTVTLNPEHTIPEAYYYNNTFSMSFTVTEKVPGTDALSLTASVGDFSNGCAQTSLYYDGFDTPELPEIEKISLTLSYYDGDSWSVWELADNEAQETSNSGELLLPSACRMNAQGNKVRFRLYILWKDSTLPAVSVYSPEYDLYYTSATAELCEESSGSLSPLERGAKSLAAGEAVIFRIRNSSTFDSGTVSCSAVIYAQQNGETTELYRKDGIQLAYGESSEPIRFDSWTAELSGQYTLVICTEGDLAGRQTTVGTLAVEEALSFKVTCDQDIVDAYDGVTSFREAITAYKLWGHPEDRITMDNAISVIYVTAPFTIDGAVRISGNGAILYGQEQVQLFYVTESGQLEIDQLCLHSGFSENVGGALENRGGDVYIENSRIIYCSSGLAGGGIFSDGGHVTLKNCSLKGNTAGDGGAISLQNGASLSMLNCNVFENSSNTGALYNNGGNAVILYSTFTNNSARSDSGSTSGGGAISSLGTTLLFGSAVSLNEKTDISGAANLYGCFVSSISDEVQTDSTTLLDSGTRFFVCDSQNAPLWTYTGAASYSTYVCSVSPLAETGIFIKNSEDGTITYSSDGDTWFATDVPSVFTNEAYQTDILEKPHGRLFGSLTNILWKVSITEVTENTAIVYSPSATKAVMLEIGFAEGRGVTDPVYYPVQLKTGMNRIPLMGVNAPMVRYTLWDSLENMIPLATPLE